MRPAPDAVSIFAPAHRRRTLGVVALVLLVAFEGIAVAAVMPVTVRDLGGLHLYAWGFSAFFTTSLAAMVVAGEECDRRGPRLPLVVGVLTFTLGLLLAGAAPTMLFFVAARGVQGLGAGPVIVALYVLVARCYPDAMRPRVFAAISSAWVLPSLVGPALAGWVADTVTWRLVFLGVAPLVVPALVLLAPALRGDARGRHMATEEPGPAVVRRGRRRLALATATGAGLLQYAGQHLDRRSVVAATAGVALLVPTMPRLLPVGTMRLRRGLPSTVVLRGLLSAAFFGADAFVPLMLVEVRGLPAALAGLSLTGGGVGWAVGSWWQGRPTMRTPRPLLVRNGALLMTLGIALLVVGAARDAPAWLPAVAWVVAGLGMGLAMSSTSVLALELSPAADQGANSAALQICDVLGSVLAIGLGGTLLAAAARGGDPQPVTFALIWTVMLLVGVAAAALAPRLRSVRA